MNKIRAQHHSKSLSEELRDVLTAEAVRPKQERIHRHREAAPCRHQSRCVAYARTMKRPYAIAFYRGAVSSLVQ